MHFCITTFNKDLGPIAKTKDLQDPVPGPLAFPSLFSQVGAGADVNCTAGQESRSHTFHDTTPGFQLRDSREGWFHVHLGCNSSFCTSLPTPPFWLQPSTKAQNDFLPFHLLLNPTDPGTVPHALCSPLCIWEVFTTNKRINKPWKKEVQRVTTLSYFSEEKVPHWLTGSRIKRLNKEELIMSASQDSWQQ